METIILLPRLVVSGFTQKYVHKWIRQNKYVQLDYIINSAYYLVFCLSAQGTHSQRSGGAPGGSSWGRHLHAWGHSEGEHHVQLQAEICLISALAPEQTPHGPESYSVRAEEFLVSLLATRLSTGSNQLLFSLQASEQIYYGNTEGVYYFSLLFSSVE